MLHSKYLTYKKCNISWVKEIPSHWIQAQLRHCVIDINNGTTTEQFDESEITKPVTRIETISLGEINWNKLGWIEPTSNDKKFLLKSGDILFSHINSLSMIGNSAIFENDKQLYHGMNLLRIQPKPEIVSRWLLYILKSKGVRNTLSAFAKPAINQASLPTHAIRSFQIPIPPHPEQLSIAAFLDRETARIDALIEKKKKLIELLKEKRTALITRAVTKGLNKEVKMKPSGIEWLGEIPEHWEVKRLKEIANINPSKSNICSDLVENDVEVSFLPMEKVGEDGIIQLNENKKISQVMNSFTYFENGDVIIAKITPCFENGKGALVQNLLNGIGFGSTEFHVWRTSPNFQKWLYYYSISGFFRKFGESSMTGAAGQKRVTTDFIKTFSVAIPPIQEIKSTTDILEGKLHDIDKLISKIDTSINKNTEYRTALISAAVTGKIRVGEE